MKNNVIFRTIWEHVAIAFGLLCYAWGNACSCRRYGAFLCNLVYYGHHTWRHKC